ncbi:MAG: SGNH/GDSL hydrolase family protein [Desulfosarcinaceae bacterium]|nr:SGNH/GDSL hydrolase family protein [Desulfosarcinaceae bacterium]
MRNVPNRKSCVFTIILTLAIVLPTISAASQFTHLVVFGDSLSDDGNLFALDPGSVPANRYFQGRLSNGPVWAEYLAGADLLDSILVNNAYAAATTDGSSPPGLGLQVAAYTAAASALPDALYAIWIGANDFLGGAVDVQRTASNIAAALEDLAEFGARHILVVDLPDLGATPRNNGNPGTAQAASGLTQRFNGELADVVAEFQDAYPAVAVYTFSVFDLFADVVANPAAYGIGNTNDVCPNFLVDDDFENDGDYLFWDDLHPTTEAHSEIARSVAETLPEPEDESDDNVALGCFIGGLSADLYQP